MQAIDYDTNGRNPKPRGQNPASAQPFGSQLFEHIRVSIIATLFLAVLVSGVYPLAVWGFAQVLFGSKANGSLIGKDGKTAAKDSDAVGSTLIGQGFSAAQYFHPRPSAAGGGYDSTASGGSNLGPTSAKLLLGTTKLSALTVFASSKAAQSPVTAVANRVQGTMSEVTRTSITLAGAGSAAGVKYPLDAPVADPNAVVAWHGRTVHATTLAPQTAVELKLDGKTPPSVIAINVIDQEADGPVASIDTNANKITLGDSAGTVVNFDPKNTVFVVDGKSDAQAGAIASGMTAHVVAASVEDNDGIADRVIHYCQDNNIAYVSSIPQSAYMDADGLDDVKLIGAFNASGTQPTITPDAAKPIPADAVTASGSGLDPHISPANAALQAPRVAAARGVGADKVRSLISQNSDGASLGFLGDAGVNVLKLNLALDREAPMPSAAAPATAPSATAVSPTTAPAGDAAAPTSAPAKP